MAAQRFHREAKAAAGLRHPNIVAIHDVGQIEGQHYLTMEFVEGRSLSSCLREGPLPPRQAAGHLRALAEAMMTAEVHLPAPGEIRITMVSSIYSSPMPAEPTAN